VLYSFAGAPDGQYPQYGVVIDSQGNLYGTTPEGGFGGCATYTCGTVFRITADGAETLLHTFGAISDRFTPVGGLVLDGKGNLWGATSIVLSFGAHHPVSGTVYGVHPPQ